MKVTATYVSKKQKQEQKRIAEEFSIFRAMKDSPVLRLISILFILLLLGIMA